MNYLPLHNQRRYCWLVRIPLPRQ